MKKSLFTIEIDALAPESVNREDMPFLSSLAGRGMTARVETTLTFTQFVEIFSGLRPQESGFWTMFKRNPGSSIYSWMKPVMPMFRLAEAAGLRGPAGKMIDVMTNYRLVRRGRTYLARKPNVPFKMLPELALFSEDAISEPGLFRGKKTIFDSLREADEEFVYVALPFIREGGRKRYLLADNSDERAVEEVLKGSRRKIYSFYHLYMRGVDHVTHCTGLGSPEVKKRIREIDTILERLYKGMNSRGRRVRFMIFSDHGMLDVKGCIDVMAAVRKADLEKDCVAFYDSTIAKFWVDRGKKPPLLQCLSGISGGHVLSGKEMEKFGIKFNNNEYGDVLFLADPGMLILPNHFQGSAPVKAMHTYAPVKGLDGMLVLEGVKAARNFTKRVHITELFRIIKREIS